MFTFIRIASDVGAGDVQGFAHYWLWRCNQDIFAWLGRELRTFRQPIGCVA